MPTICTKQVAYHFSLQFLLFVKNFGIESLCTGLQACAAQVVIQFTRSCDKEYIIITFTRWIQSTLYMTDL